MVVIIGYDPGVSPSLSLVCSKRGWLDYADKEKTGVRVTKTRWEPSGQLVKAALDDWMVLYDIDAVCAEKVQAFAGQGLVSTANFVGASRLIEGVCIGMGLPVYRVTPPTWKRAMGLIKKDKDYSRHLASELWPHMAKHLTRKLDHDKAEAALIAQYHINQKGGWS